MTDHVNKTIPPGGAWVRAEGPLTAHSGWVKIQNLSSDCLLVSFNPEGAPDSRALMDDPTMTRDGGERIGPEDDLLNDRFDGAADQLWLRYPDGESGSVVIYYGDPQ